MASNVPSIFILIPSQGRLENALSTAASIGSGIWNGIDCGAFGTRRRNGVLGVLARWWLFRRLVRPRPHHKDVKEPAHSLWWMNMPSDIPRVMPDLDFPSGEYGIIS